VNSADTGLHYRRIAVQHATSAGLMVVLYDMLVDDLRRASDAVRNGDIEARSGLLKHAFTVLELLESSLDHRYNESGAQSLSRFYGFLRNQLLAAQFQSNDQVLDRQIALILDVREAWQQADAQALAQLRDSSATAMLKTRLSDDSATEALQWFA
jgi:flagellar protein FliS